MVLEVRHLRVIDAVIKEGGATKAAKRLFLTQPAVSHTIRDLEKRLGVSLFRRESKKMIPTAEGLRLLRAAEIVLDAVERAEQDLGSYREGRRGTLRIATQCYSCYRWLPRLLSDFHAAAPDVDLEVVPEATNDPLSALLAERIELALVHRFPEHADIITMPLFEDEMVFIVSPGHRLADHETVEPIDLADEHILLDVEPETSLVMNRFFAPAGVHPSRMSRLGSADAIIDTVRAGLAISFIPRWMVADDVESGSLVTVGLAPNGLHRAWHAAILRKNSEHAAIVELIRLLESVGERSPSQLRAISA